MCVPGDDWLRGDVLPLSGHWGMRGRTLLFHSLMWGGDTDVWIYVGPTAL